MDYTCLTPDNEKQVNRLLREIDQLLDDSREGNTDNYGGKPGSDDSYKNTRQFICLMSNELLGLTPTVALLPDGFFCLDWDKWESEFSIAVSFEPNNKLCFSCEFDNGDRQRGAETFNSKRIPEVISTSVKRVINESVSK